MHLPVTSLGTIPENKAPYSSKYDSNFSCTSSLSSVATQHNPHSNDLDSAAIGYDFDRDDIYALIDRVIPFEACLYHQVLPLSLVDNQLRLGMVDLADVSALDYLRKVLAYLQYRLVPQVIPSDLHHQLLSGYLKFKAHQDAIAPVEEATIFFERTPDEVPQVILEDEDFDGPPTIFFDRPVTSLEEVEDEPTLSFEKTLIVEAPVELNNSEVKAEIKPAPQPRPKRPIVPAPSLQQFDRSTIIQSAPPEKLTPLPEKLTPPPALAVPGNALPLLEVNTLPFSTDQLFALTPKELLQALLGRILTSGIGRLYFEHQGEVGRVLSSDSGVFQTVIEELPIVTFNGIITELKHLTALPLAPVQQTLQVEIERLYDKSRLLLRLRLIPKQLEEGKTSSEDATLQILQGSALRFYQQQQVSSLSRDTLSVARQLQRKVEELHRRSHASPPINSDELAVMPELQEVLQNVKNQLIEIERQTSTVQIDRGQPLI
jgi:Type II secretion system (T2SS), protein E, N-terminal domain